MKKYLKVIVTVEEHFIYGGLGGAVAEAIAGERNRPRHLILGVRDKYLRAASYDYLIEMNGLDAKGIARNIKAFLES